MNGAVFQDVPFDRGYRGSSKNSRRLFYFIFGLLILGAVIFGISRFFSTSETKETITPTVTPTQVLFPTDTPTPSPEISVTPSVPPTPTPRTIQDSLDKATGLDRKDVSVSVQNGSGQTGVGSKMAEFLKGFGYKVVSIGNADAFTYENVSISVKTEKKKYLPLLRKDITQSYTVGSTTEDLSASSSSDILVIVGK
ncbi:MAG: LytR C-terminal domain-containing protein [Candidatus Levybacteria bacterium]|nr:LytR C-terminal domain-containing protein [Candidatus Levybacteria bacterium]